MADNPEVWNNLADAISERVGEKLFDRGFSRNGDIAELKGQFKALDHKFDRMEKSIDIILNRVQTYETTIDVSIRKIGKGLEKRVLEAIDRHLGVPR